jgi:hypothetical protein
MPDYDDIVLEADYWRTVMRVCTEVLDWVEGINKDLPVVPLSSIIPFGEESPTVMLAAEEGLASLTEAQKKLHKVIESVNELSGLAGGRLKVLKERMDG